MSKNDKLQLTSVKVNSELFDNFKVLTIRTKFSLQKLVERSMYLYLEDEDFRKTLHNQLNTMKTGSI